MDVGSTMDFPLSMIEVEIIFMDADCEIGGGFDNEKTPMREETFIRPIPIF